MLQLSVGLQSYNFQQIGAAHFQEKRWYLTKNLSILATAKSPTPGEWWTSNPEIHRIEAVKNSLKSFKHELTDYLEPVSAKLNGQVSFRLTHELNVAVRVDFLLDAEEHLKAVLDQGITLWLEPMKDRSSLRRLRGVEIKYE